MRYTIRTLLCLLLALCLLVPMTACNSGNWRGDLTATQVRDAVAASLNASDGWKSVSENYISPSSWGEDYADYLDKVTDYSITVSENSDMNIDEIGVFRCKSQADAQAVKTFCENYLATKKLQMTPLLESYNPGELPKLDYAAVNVIGCYVMYTVLDSASTTVAGSAMEKALTPAE